MNSGICLQKLKESVSKNQLYKVFFIDGASTTIEAYRYEDTSYFYSSNSLRSRILFWRVTILGSKWSSKLYEELVADVPAANIATIVIANAIKEVV